MVRRLNRIWYIIIVAGILIFVYLILELVEKWNVISSWWKNKISIKSELEERVEFLENKLTQMAERFKSVDEIESFYQTLNTKTEKTED